ncbi:MAG: VanZ family protein [Candidatus Cloacimonetes bacterium]|nr:VanZ family protein [Candidatus Cloacimonadota bacterium]
MAFWSWCGFILVLTSMPTTPWSGPESLSLDKLAHLVLYAVFAALFLRMRRLDGAAHRSGRELLILMPIVPLLDEVHQLFIPGRNCSWLDILADMTGITIIIIAHFTIRRHARKPKAL